jgi:ectoine hydroxylase-related dioxygenase (phytanoyl-CoA dioxygenase family)
MAGSVTTRLSAEQKEQYDSQGYCFPFRVFEESEAALLRARFEDYYSSRFEQVKNLPAREHNSILLATHVVLNWVYRLVSHPQVLDAVESILGPNLLVWGAQWFPKMPGDKKYISWHQDATYWGLHPPSVTTAWIALSESVPENGCMRVIPGTHQGPLLPQVDTYAFNNALSRGQEIAVKVDESQAVDLVLKPGEMSLHHIGIVHGSNANESTKPRIGMAVRYISTDVVQDGSVRQCAVRVRGKDEFGHFQLVDAPDDDVISAADEARREEFLGRVKANLMASGGQKR